MKMPKIKMELKPAAPAKKVSPLLFALCMVILFGVPYIALLFNKH